MAEETSDDPLERILNASNRDHLDNPFRTSAELRAKHFPGAGKKLSHTRLTKAYLNERDDPEPDWQLLAHGTWPWLIGHGHDLAALIDDLEKTPETGEKQIDSGRRKVYVEKYSEAGAAEIEVFLRIFANGGRDFQKAVIERLKSNPAAPAPAPRRVARSTSEPRTPAQSNAKPTVEDLDPVTRARMAMIGTLFFLALSLIPLGIQFWRQPDQDHEIVLGISGILGLLTLICVIDYLRKKP